MDQRRGYGLSQQDILSNTLGTCLDPVLPLLYHANCAPAHLPAPATSQIEPKEKHSDARQHGNRDKSESEGDCSKLVLHLSPLEPLLKHPATIALEKKLEATVPELFEYLFLKSHPYGSVCFRSPHDQPGDGVTYYSRADFHHLLHTYILKRSACIPFIQAEGFAITRNYRSSTDDAFLLLITTFITKLNNVLAANGALENLIQDIPRYGLTVTILDQRFRKGLHIITSLPMEFSIQKTINHIALPEENALVWFQDVEPKGYWTMSRQYMRKPMARCVAPDTNYIC